MYKMQRDGEEISKSTHKKLKNIIKKHVEVKSPASLFSFLAGVVLFFSFFLLVVLYLPFSK